MERFTVQSGGDIVAAIVGEFGYIPSRSLVVILLDETRVYGGFRAEAEDTDAVAEAARRMASQGQPTGSLVVGFDATDAEVEAGREAVAAVVEVEAVVTTDMEVVRGPEPGTETPLDLMGHPLIAHLVTEGQVVLRSREDREREYVPASEGSQTTAEAVAAERRRATADPASWLLRVSRVVTRCTAGESITGDDLAAVVAAVQVKAARDVLWSQITRANARSSAQFWAQVVRRTPEGLALGALGLAAFASWVQGDGTGAATASERALAIDPTYGLAQLVDQALTEVVNPALWEEAQMPREAIRTAAEAALAQD